MVLILVVPALLWPRQVMRDVLYDADLPALQTLLGKGRLMTKTFSAPTVEDWWANYFGATADALSAGPLRLVAAGIDPGDDNWLCVDPVHLRIDPRGAVVADPALLNIGPTEARQLSEALAPLLAHIGELVVATPSHWHLRLHDGVSLPPLPRRLDQCVEKSANCLLPEGDAGRSLRQLFNEAQMALHAHAVNEQRAAQGRATINSIALWGMGCAPRLTSRAGTRLLTDDRVIAGAGGLAGMEVSPLPPRFAANGGDCIVFWDSLKFPTASRDAIAWREQLEGFEATWMAPALAALADGRVSRIELHGFGDDEGFAVTMSRLDRHAFWRKPRRIESL